MIREIVLDTETTGLSPVQGHKLVEIGCIELVGGIRTGRTFHQYINPDRDMPEEARRVHGLTREFLSQYPLFHNIYHSFLDFICDSTLVIHNARFDMSFLNAELQMLGHNVLTNPVVDTLALAKKKFPGAPASLDALCRQFFVDTSRRAYHGALLDAELLSEVYIELTGGKQTQIAFAQGSVSTEYQEEGKSFSQRPVRVKRTFSVTEEELLLHQHMMKKFIK